MDADIQPQQAWLAYCRAGFERDLAEELHARFHCTATNLVENSSFVVAPGARMKALNETAVSTLTFARQLILTHTTPVSLTSNDRVNPILERLITFLEFNHILSVTDCWVEYPDTNDGKVLSRAAKAIEPRLREALSAQNKIAGHAKYRAHVFITPDRQAWVGVAEVTLSQPDPLGIPRIRMPHDAPSRSTLKLAEAFQVFLGENQAQALQPDMRAVDLGAAPGGWTWQLMGRGIRVTAVDNADLKGDLVDNAMVKHMRMDGFKYAPRVSVDWMVCDMVESPSRIARLVSTWLVNDWARYIIFNLKLPMKKRYAEMLRCHDMIAAACEDAGKPLVLQIKQLYHDREEVTGFATIPTRRSQFAHNLTDAAVARRSERAARSKVSTVREHASEKTAAKGSAGSAGEGRKRSGVESPATKRKPATATSTSPWSAKPPPKQKRRT